MKARGIGGSINGIENLGKVLFDFDAKAVISNYNTDWKAVFEEIKTKLKPRGKLLTEPQSIWPKYCKSILSGASFLSQFSTANDFYEWVGLFDSDDKTRAALPMLLANEINGFGFALACDFLKELGFFNFAKPDVHLRDIFEALGLCAGKVNDYRLFKAILRVAKNSGKTPYAVDKIFWLIGSGNFYNHRDIGNAGRIPSRKKRFY